MSDSLQSRIAANLRSVRERIAEAAEGCGRPPGGIVLVAVSKTWPAATVAAALAAGQRAFGENRVQELEEKAPALPPEAEWHLVGHLQSNKVRKALPLCSWIHSVDSLDLARRIDRVAADLGLRPRVLLQVNISGDEAKFGFSAGELASAMDELAALERLDLGGLMTVPAFDPDPERTRSHFARLRELRDRLSASSGLPLAELSMGMSHDYAVAVEEGATFVRVGSAIFGQRG